MKLLYGSTEVCDFPRETKFTSHTPLLRPERSIIVLFHMSFRLPPEIHPAQSSVFKILLDVTSLNGSTYNFLIYHIYFISTFCLDGVASIVVRVSYLKISFDKRTTRRGTTTMASLLNDHARTLSRYSFEKFKKALKFLREEELEFSVLSGQSILNISRSIDMSIARGLRLDTFAVRICSVARGNYYKIFYII